MDPRRPTPPPHAWQVRTSHGAERADPPAPAECLPAERVGVGVLQRHVQRVRDADVWAWMARWAPGTRRHLTTRDGDLAVAGAGTALVLEGGDLGVLRHLPRSEEVGADGGLLAFLSARFDLAAVPSEGWRPFGAVRLVVPAVELRRHEGAWWAVRNTVDGMRPAPAASTAGAPPAGGGLHAVAALSTTRGSWDAALGDLLGRIERGALAKGVLARRATFEAPAPIDPVALLARLDAEGGRGYRYLLEAGPGDAFLGLSPERLLWRRGTRLCTEALAGTAPASGEAAEDARRGEALLASAKDRREHALVVDHLVERLGPRVAHLRRPTTPVVQRAGRVLHLATPLEAEAAPDRDDADLLGALHPTPAVAGRPVSAALAWLRTHEDFDRGLYGGLVGLVGPMGCDIAVALRSARTHGTWIETHAGAGIVAGSTSEAEWRETDHKLAALHAALGA